MPRARLRLRLPRRLRCPSSGESPQDIAHAPAFIVQGATVDAALHGVQSVGARNRRSKLEVIRAVAVNLTPSQVARLRATPGLRVYADRQLRTSGSLLSLVKNTVNNTNSTAANVFVVQTITQLTTPTVFSLLATPVLSAVTSPVVQSLSSSTSLQDGTGVAGLTLAYETNYPALIGADSLQRAGITGKGVTIAMLDTGLWNDATQFYGTRILATRDVTNGGTGAVKGDPYGHGTHITSIAASGAQNLAGQVSRYRAEGESRGGARVRRLRRGPLRRCDLGHQLDRRQQGEVQHPRPEPVARRAPAVVLLGRSAQPGRRWRRGRRASSWSRPRATKAPIR